MTNTKLPLTSSVQVRCVIINKIIYVKNKEYSDSDFNNWKKNPKSERFIR